MHLSLKFFAVTTVVFLAACSPPHSKPNMEPIPEGETNTAVRAFSDICLGTLPKFEQSAAHAERNGLKPLASKGGIIHIDPRSPRIMTDLAESHGTKLCSIAFMGSSNIPEVRKEFLREVVRRTGGASVRELPEQEEWVGYHLTNKSVFSHAVQIKGKHTLHILMISEPVSIPDLAL
jgi:hypothetical protein